MTKGEEFERHLLSKAPPSVSPQGNHVDVLPAKEANDFRIPEEHICQLMVEMYRSGLISLHVFDGQRECSLQEWLSWDGTQGDFFHYCVRVRLTATGAEREGCEGTNRAFRRLVDLLISSVELSSSEPSAITASAHDHSSTKEPLQMREPRRHSRRSRFA